MDYVYFAFLAAVFFAGVTLLVKYISKRVVHDADIFLFWSYVSVLPLILWIPFVKGLTLEMTVVGPMVVNSLLLTAGMLLFSRGIMLVDASVVGPMFQLQSGFIVLLATLLLGERYPLVVYTLLGLMMVGSMLVAVTDETKLTAWLQKGVQLIIGMQLLHAGANIAAGVALKHAGNNWQVVFYSFLFNAVWVGVYALTKKIKMKIGWQQFRWFLLRGLLLMTATALLYKAFETNVSISAALGLLSSPLVFGVSVLCAKFYPELLEKQNLRTYAIRTVGMMIILFSAWQIAMRK